MENTPTSTGTKQRWLWVVFGLLMLMLLGVGGYLLTNGKPAYYSPVDVVRKGSDYQKKLNPPKISPPNTNSLSSLPPKVTITTNKNNIRIERPYSGASKSVEGLGFVLHRANGTGMMNVEGLTVKLGRIAHAWVPPSTNTQSSYQYNIPAAFYRADLKPLSADELVREVPGKWNQTLSCRNEYNSYRFDFELTGEAWKFLGATLYDARTQARLTSGHSSSSDGKGFQLKMDPHLWHQVPVDLVVDLAVGPVETEEISPQAGVSFISGPVRYQLVFASGNMSTSSSSSGSDGKVDYWEMPVWNPQFGRKKECVFIFTVSEPVDNTNVEFVFFDAAGKSMETSGYSRSGNHMYQGVYGELEDIKKIRVRKFPTGHRIVFRLPGLPGLPASNQNLNNLFQVRVPVLRFDLEYEQKEYIQQVAQLEFGRFPYTNLPPGTYPRYFTNATLTEVLQDYESLVGVRGQAYVNQEALTIEVGKKPWPFETGEKIRRFAKKIFRP